MNEIIHFYRHGCFDCKYLDKILDEMKYKYNISVKTINAGNDIMQTETYNIIKVPTLIFMKDGFEVDRIGKLVGESAIERMIKKHF